MKTAVWAAAFFILANVFAAFAGEGGMELRAFGVVFHLVSLLKVS